MGKAHEIDRSHLSILGVMSQQLIDRIDYDNEESYSHQPPESVPENKSGEDGHEYQE